MLGYGAAFSASPPAGRGAARCFSTRCSSRRAGRAARARLARRLAGGGARAPARARRGARRRDGAADRRARRHPRGARRARRRPRPRRSAARSRPRCSAPAAPDPAPQLDRLQAGQARLEARAAAARRRRGRRRLAPPRPRAPEPRRRRRRRAGGEPALPRAGARRRPAWSGRSSSARSTSRATPTTARASARCKSALRHHGLAQVLQAAEDVLNLLSQEGVFVDELPMDAGRHRGLAAVHGRASAAPEVAGLGGIADERALDAARGLMQTDSIFRDSALFFQRRFDRVLAEFGTGASDAEIEELAGTRSGPRLHAARPPQRLARLRDVPADRYGRRVGVTEVAIWRPWPLAVCCHLGQSVTYPIVGCGGPHGTALDRAGPHPVPRDVPRPARPVADRAGARGRAAGGSSRAHPRRRHRPAPHRRRQPGRGRGRHGAARRHRRRGARRRR